MFGIAAIALAVAVTAAAGLALQWRSDAKAAGAIEERERYLTEIARDNKQLAEEKDEQLAAQADREAGLRAESGERIASLTDQAEGLRQDVADAKARARKAENRPEPEIPPCVCTADSPIFWD